MVRSVTALLLSLHALAFAAPATFDIDGVRDERTNAVAFTDATVIVDSETTLQNATLLIRDGRVVKVGRFNPEPDYAVVSLQGRYVYPGLIELHSDYGQPPVIQPKADFGPRAEVMTPQQTGAFNANDSIRSHYHAVEHFSADSSRREKLRELGFSAVLSQRFDGIARGTSTLVTLADQTDNEVIHLEKAAAHHSLTRSGSPQAMPSSAMGVIALWRQTHYDGQWYETGGTDFTDQSLKSWQENLKLPQIFSVSSWRELLRINKLAQEFDVRFIVKSGGDDYQRLDAVRNTGFPLILPLAFPDAPNVNDPFIAETLGLDELKHWELAPYNPARVAEAGIPFALTAAGSGDNFRKNLRRAIEAGLSEKDALRGLTENPAEMLGVSDLGHLRTGAVANFLITSGPLFEEKTRLLENWINGYRHLISEYPTIENGQYLLTVADRQFPMKVSGVPGKPRASITLGDERSASANIVLDDGLIALSFIDEASNFVLSGWQRDGGWTGKGRMNDSGWLNWSLTAEPPETTEDDTTGEEEEEVSQPGPVIFPFTAFGSQQGPESEDLLIRGATVWTLTDEAPGILDVHVRDGRIHNIGKKLNVPSVRHIDGTGMHLTPGLVDEHSHIALDSVNEWMTNSAMVRMQDVVNSEDVGIYRALAGGVTTAQLLHGSANPIGGQSALVKMRWGSLPDQMLIRGADGFIKFALGENVKRSRNPASIRFPQTRMGVEQVYEDAFSAARDYAVKWQSWNELSKRKQRAQKPPRTDLALAALSEVLAGRRFVTAHSYVQSEINMLMKVAERYGFHINTFTHILEGYKVADTMAAHGAGGSTFSDNWAYKWEVRYAIPYNAALMQRAGVTVAINSDSPERIRRMNHEAAKAVKYGGVSEVEALKMVTLNPATLLHLEDRIGSIEQGKDADLVLWSAHPLSVYAVPVKTIVDGRIYFDRDKDLALQQQAHQERYRLTGKLQRAISKGAPVSSKSSASPRYFTCDSSHGYEYTIMGDLL